MKRIIYLLLAIIFIADQYFIYNKELEEFRIITKPLLIPILIVCYSKLSIKLNHFFVSGLIFSFFGDLFLLFNWGFILGLSSFLIAHIFYIFALKNMRVKFNFYSVPIIFLYIVGLVGFLYPHLNEMRLPVMAYALTISTMLFIAINTEQKWLIIGALFFVISDSILAINIFYKRELFQDLMVMITYVIAQVLLCYGFAAHSNATLEEQND